MFLLLSFSTLRSYVFAEFVRGSFTQALTSAAHTDLVYILYRGSVFPLLLHRIHYMGRNCNY